MEYSGLSDLEVKDRINKNLVNHSTNHHTRTKKEIILTNIFTYFNFINAFLFFLVCLTGSFHNGAFFLTIIFNDCICIFQELKAKRLLDKMSLLIVEEIDTLRNSDWIKVKANALVQDDVIALKSGMQIPADSKILEGYLEVNEAILTGEAEGITKKVNDTVLAGTIITSGKAILQVIHVGKDNFSETIMSDAKKYKQAKSILNAEINQLLKIISILIIPIGLLLFLSQTNSDLSRNEAILKTVSAIIGMIPEGVVVLISLALTISTIRLSKQDVLIQDLNSIEALARIDTLCIDKTGTITKGTLKVEDIKLLKTTKQEIDQILGAYVHVFKNGNATDVALQNYFVEVSNQNITDTLPFSSERKFAGIEINNSFSYYVGAYQFLFEQKEDKLNQLIEQYASFGKRVLVVSKSDAKLTNHPVQLECLAMIIMEDELRDNIQNVLIYYKDNGIKIKLISGDQVETVSFLAKKAGIENYNHSVDMSQNHELTQSLVEDNDIFGRVLPSQKKEIIDALQRNGHTVAMVGDGVNDVLALKKADVSISLKEASSSAKNIANIVLLSNDFGALPSIVNEGRRVINNISRGATLFFVKTGFSLFISIYVILFHENYPFLPIHLTLIGMFGVAVPTFFLQFEPSYERIQNQFLKQALSKAIPSSLTVCLITIICNKLFDALQLDTNELHTIVVFTTFLVYSYTLKKVYVPLNRYRKTILILMIIAMILSMIILPTLFQLSFTTRSVLILIVLSILSPFFINVFQIIVDKIFIKID